MTLEELVRAFDPEDSSNPVGIRLKRYVGDNPFIVYDAGRTVNVDITLQLLKEVKEGYPCRKIFEVGESIKEVYSLGDLPDNFADENPLYPGRPLRPDGSCDQLNRSWQGVCPNVRRFIRFAVEQKDGIKVDFDAAHAVLDLALTADALKKLRSRYPNVAVAYDRAAKENKLPTMQVRLEKVKKANKSPFDDGRKVVVSPQIPANKKNVEKIVENQAMWKYVTTHGYNFDNGKWYSNK